LLQKEWHGEFCNKKKNGEIFWEYAVISPIINSEGITTNYVAVKENITERKRMEREEEELVGLIENSAAFVARTDIHRNILYINPALRDIT
jgi:PAS domain-containing protein